ncbi:hypothetical protein [Rhizobacter sp. Root1221]|uniref:SCO family protein n=1 Tax=Rhizobacter sp. Root1221 TaxID=1736433 RepID=UPI0006F89ABC|nr:hypothetical protein [Rhizobacter sp. Root1221]KQV94474.1 hypothetical protein ASC87_26615 [Rhizobacter sp. Root1221]
MSGSNSSAPESPAPTPEALSLTVHSVPALAPQRRRLSGRLQMLLVLAVCAAPVVASYFTYYVVRPGGRTNYSDLIDPQRPLPEQVWHDLAGAPVKSSSLKGQWLLVSVAGGACDAACEKTLYLQRQLRETLGKERDRLDKVWLVADDAPVRPEVLAAISPRGAEATVLRVPREALAAWLAPAAGHVLDQHLYIVDPMGNWMMRAPADPQPAKLKRDLEKLLRASSSWDNPGR